MLQLVNCALLHSIKCPKMEDKWPHHHKSIPTSLLLSDFLLFLYPGTGLWDFLHLASHYASFNTLLGSLPLVALFKLWKIQLLSHLHPHSIFFFFFVNLLRQLGLSHHAGKASRLDYAKKNHFCTLYFVYHVWHTEHTQMLAKWMNI